MEGGVTVVTEGRASLTGTRGRQDESDGAGRAVGRGVHAGVARVLTGLAEIQA